MNTKPHIPYEQRTEAKFFCHSASREIREQYPQHLWVVEVEDALNVDRLREIDWYLNGHLYYRSIEEFLEMKCQYRDVPVIYKGKNMNTYKEPQYVYVGNVLVQLI